MFYWNNNSLKNKATHFYGNLNFRIIYILFNFGKSSRDSYSKILNIHFEAGGKMNV